MIALILLASVAADGDQADPKAKDPVVCHTVLRTGSRMPTRRVCKTASEWEIIRTRARQDLTEMQLRARPEQLPPF